MKPGVLVMNAPEFGPVASERHPLGTQATPTCEDGDSLHRADTRVRLVRVQWRRWFKSDFWKGFILAGELVGAVLLEIAVWVAIVGGVGWMLLEKW